MIWFSRFVLAAATFLMTMIALRNLRDPICATLPLDIALGVPQRVSRTPETHDKRGYEETPTRI